MLRGEGVFEKQLAEAAEEEKVTWVPRQRILNRAHGCPAAGGGQASAGEEARPVRALLRTRILLGSDKPAGGTAGLTEHGTFVFEPAGQEGAKVVLAPEELEAAQLAGFPARVLRLTLLSGRMHEFSAGFLVANAPARAIAKELTGRLKAGR